MAFDKGFHLVAIFSVQEVHQCMHELAHWGRNKCIVLNQNIWISITISLNLIPKAPNDNKSALV